MNTPAGKSFQHPIPIAFVIDQLGVGGTERQLAVLLQGLDLNLFSPLLVTIREHENRFDTPGKRYVFPTQKLVSVRGPVNVFRIALLLRREHVRIVQTFFFDAAIVGILAAHLARVPVKILSRRDMGFWQTPSKRLMMRLLNRMSDRLLVNSRSVRRQIMETEGVSDKKIDVIYNGIDMAPFHSQTSPAQVRAKLGIAGKAPVVGIVANLNREVKRVDLFLGAAGIVSKKFPGAQFIVAGEGHLRPILEEKSRAFGLNGAVRFLGSERAIPALLSTLDVGVNCSDSEGMSNAVIEYMAAGIPAVVSTVPGNCELVADGVEGLHFPAGDALALAERITHLLANPYRAREMGRRGREKARKQFSSESMVRKHMDYYLGLLQEKQGTFHTV